MFAPYFFVSSVSPPCASSLRSSISLFLLHHLCTAKTRRPARSASHGHLRELLCLRARPPPSAGNLEVGSSQPPVGFLRALRVSFASFVSRSCLSSLVAALLHQDLFVFMGCGSAAPSSSASQVLLLLALRRVCICRKTLTVPADYRHHPPDKTSRPPGKLSPPRFPSRCTRIASVPWQPTHNFPDPRFSAPPQPVFLRNLPKTPLKWLHLYLIDMLAITTNMGYLYYLSHPPQNPSRQMCEVVLRV